MKLCQLSAPPEVLSKVELPLFNSHIRAGFPSPADDFIDKHLDLNEFLIKSPASTFFAWAEGESLRGIGIHDGDLLIIDRSINAKNGDVVVAAIDGELTCKILDTRQKLLLSANKAFPPIAICGQEELIIEGVIIFSIKQHKKNR